MLQYVLCMGTAHTKIKKKKNAIWNAPTVSGTSSGVCELTNQPKTEKEYSAAALGNMR